MRALAISISISCVALSGCGLEAIDDGGDGGDQVPAEVQAAFDQSCALPGCHAGGVGPDLTAGGSAQILSTNGTTGEPFVVLGDVDGSYLAQKILGGPGIQGGTMPPGASNTTTAANTALIIGWIAGVEFGSGGGTDTGSSDTGTDPMCFIDAAPAMPTFDADVWPILEGRCALSGCHLSLAPLMPDSAGAYANLVGVQSPLAMIPQVDPGTPDGSYMWHKLSGTQTLAGGGGGTMPSGGALCVGEFQTIYSWILAGAPQ
ncbi:MAG: hypothetical protein KC457_09250 [Myxococcales bacterium]|nr:hypothetical protein [Myxococcales bacterium]